MQKNVVNVSGGKDSTAMYLLALEQLQGDFIPVFADTGNEHEITLEYISRLPERTGGPKIRWVKADFQERIEKRKRTVDASILEAVKKETSSFLAMCLWKGMFPFTTGRFCTSELKIFPIEKYVYAPLIDNGHTIVSWQGVRADESKKRSKLEEIEELGDGVTAYRPLLTWSIKDVFAMHKRHGLEPNPLYKMGFSRVGCMPCFMARKQEISQMARRFPEHIDKIRRWEKLVQKASKSGLSTFFPAEKVPGTENLRSAVNKVVAWAQGKTPGQLEFFADFKVSSCQSVYGLCE